MVVEQNMTQEMMQVVNKVAKTVIMAIREVDNPVNNERLVHASPRLGGQVLKQPMFDWKVADKYQELCNFEI